MGVVRVAPVFSKPGSHTAAKCLCVSMFMCVCVCVCVNMITLPICKCMCWGKGGVAATCSPQEDPI